jgi:predicted nucleic acid-binding protein
VTLRDSAREASRLFESENITDIYLLALARSRDGQLVTFDQGISLAASEARPEHLCVLTK